MRYLQDQGVRIADMAGATVTPSGAVHIADTSSSSLAIPPRPRNVAISRQGLSPLLIWDLPASVSNAAYAEIWHTEDGLAANDATLLGVVTLPNTSFVHDGANIRATNVYWVRFVSSGGKHSAMSDSVTLPSFSSECISDLYQQVLQSTTHGTSYTVLADSFRVVGEEITIPAFVVDAEKGAAINGQLIADGAIAGKSLDAAVIHGELLAANAKLDLHEGGFFHLHEGARLFAGNGNVLLDTAGDNTSLTFGKNGAISSSGAVQAEHDVCSLETGDLSFRSWDSVTQQHEVQYGIVRMESGVFDATDPDTYTIVDGKKAIPLTGLWLTDPAILFSPFDLVGFDCEHPAQTQYVQVAPHEYIRQGRTVYVVPHIYQGLEANSTDREQEGTLVASSKFSSLSATHTYSVSNDSMIVGANRVSAEISLPSNTISRTYCDMYVAYTQYGISYWSGRVYRSVYTAYATCTLTVTWSDGTSSAQSATSYNAASAVVGLSKVGATAVTAVVTNNVSYSLQSSGQIGWERGYIGDHSYDNWSVQIAAPYSGVGLTFEPQEYESKGRFSWLAIGR